MKTTWIVVADASRARIIASSGRQAPFNDVAQMVHGESRLKDTARISDRPGRSFDRHGEGRHSMEPRVDPSEQEAVRFAHDIAGRITEGRVDGEFDDLVLVAAPHFLGLLRQAIDDNSSKCIRQELDKNLAQFDDEEIRNRLSDLL